MQIIVRLATLPKDYPAMADVLTEECPQWPTTEQDLAHEDTTRDQKFHHAAFVAEFAREHEVNATFLDETPKRIIGVGKIGHDTLAYRKDKFKMDIRIRPAMQGYGAGKLLYEAILKHLKAFAPYDLYTEVWEAHPRAVRFVSERGFIEVWRRVDWRLHTTTFDFTPYAALEKHINFLGIEIKTYDQLAGDHVRLAKLHALDQLLWQHVPYGEPVSRSLIQFEQEEIQVAKFLPDACFIAIHNGQYIGYSNLTDSGEVYDINMTGVLAAYRGKGIAILLKLYGIRYAQLRSRDLWTVNDSINAPIQTLNEKLGFQRQGATIRFTKRVTT